MNNPRKYQVSLQDLFFNNQVCKLLQFRDISDISNLARVSAENKMLSLLTSSVTHEMLTPLKCIIEFAHMLIKELQNSPLRRIAELVLSTSKLLLSEVKTLLDKIMIEKNLFVPELGIHSLN